MNARSRSREEGWVGGSDPCREPLSPTNLLSWQVHLQLQQLGAQPPRQDAPRRVADARPAAEEHHQLSEREAALEVAELELGVQAARLDRRRVWMDEQRRKTPTKRPPLHGF